MTEMQKLCEKFEWLQNEIKVCEHEMEFAIYLGSILKYDRAEAEWKHWKDELKATARRMFTLYVTELAD